MNGYWMIEYLPESRERCWDEKLDGPCQKPGLFRFTRYGQTSYHCADRVWTQLRDVAETVGAGEAVPR